MFMKIALALLVACMGCGLHAKTLSVGEEAPDFEAGGKLLFPPEFARNMDDCEGNVVLIYEWHIRDGTSSGLKTIQKYWDDHRGKGLHVFTIHRLDFEKWPEVECYCRKSSYDFPVAMGGFYDEDNDFFGYKADEGGFRTTVVGADGKVKFYGNEKGWESVLKTELDAIVYPNLGKDEVHDDVVRASKYFAKREFGKALVEAEKILEGEDLDREAEEDAQRIVEFCTELAEERQARIKKWNEEGRYDLVSKTLEVLEDEFKGHSIGDDAKDARREMKKDREIKKELGAFEKLDALIDKEGARDWRSYVTALKAFTQHQRGTNAAAVAEKLAADIEWTMEE